MRERLGQDLVVDLASHVPHKYAVVARVPLYQGRIPPGAKGTTTGFRNRALDAIEKT